MEQREFAAGPLIEVAARQSTTGKPLESKTSQVGQYTFSSFSVDTTPGTRPKASY
jgi:hypothetical protein